MYIYIKTTRYFERNMVLKIILYYIIIKLKMSGYRRTKRIHQQSLMFVDFQKTFNHFVV